MLPFKIAHLKKCVCEHVQTTFPEPLRNMAQSFKKSPCCILTQTCRGSRQNPNHRLSDAFMEKTHGDRHGVNISIPTEAFIKGGKNQYVLKCPITFNSTKTLSII